MKKGIIITGDQHTGKTTRAKQIGGEDARYFNVDNLDRAFYYRVFADNYQTIIIDEIPNLIQCEIIVIKLLQQNPQMIIILVTQSKITRKNLPKTLYKNFDILKCIPFNN